MPLLLDTARFGSPSELLGSNCLTIGFVNNMPDTAVGATERQFIDLVRAASADAVVRLKLFAISEVPRSELVQSEFIERYRDISELWDTRLDGLIVTGTEPRAAALADEPYWPELAKLVAWAQENTISTIWSCLAAHAAVLQADGIERRRLDDKLFGVFDHDVVAEHPLLNGLPSRLSVPHSRYHDLPEAALTSCGYRVLTSSASDRRGHIRSRRGRLVAVRLFPRPSGIRGRYAGARVPSRYRPLPPRRTRAVPGDAAKLF